MSKLIDLTGKRFGRLVALRYEPYALHFPHLTVDGKLILDVLRFLRGKPELKFFVDSDGKMTPLPVQKHGHWISVIKDNGHYSCSCCGTGRYMNFVPNYCSECGAKMDEEVTQDG
jgi:hypothetical protein